MILGQVLLLYATPALASLFVAASAWRLASGRGARWPWAPATLIALVSVGLAVLVYAAHPSDVSSSRALGGAVGAPIGSALALSMYYALGLG